MGVGAWVGLQCKLAGCALHMQLHPYEQQLVPTSAARGQQRQLLLLGKQVSCASQDLVTLVGCKETALKDTCCGEDSGTVEMYSSFKTSPFETRPG